MKNQIKSKHLFHVQFGSKFRFEAYLTLSEIINKVYNVEVILTVHLVHE